MQTQEFTNVENHADQTTYTDPRAMQQQPYGQYQNNQGTYYGQPSQPELKKNKSGWLIPVLCVVLLLLIGGIVAVVLLNNKSEKDLQKQLMTAQLEQIEAEKAKLEQEKKNLELENQRAAQAKIDAENSARAAQASEAQRGKYKLSGYFLSHESGNRNPIKLSFTERNGNISGVKYTNVKYHTTLSMTGYKDGDYYTFYGNDGTDDFSIEVYKNSENSFSGSAQVGYHTFDVSLSR